MQSLRESTDSSPRDCARAMLEGMPLVTWFIRSCMREHRTAGLSVPQFRMLVLLDRYPTASLSLAAEHLGCSLPCASRMISGLVTRGLVTRQDSASDRRVLSLVLTPKGRSSLQAARQATQDHIADQIVSLTDEQRCTITQAMRLVQSAFDDSANWKISAIGRKPGSRTAKSHPVASQV